MFFLISLIWGLILLLGLLGIGTGVGLFATSRIAASADKKSKVLANFGIFSTLITFFFAAAAAVYFFSIGDWGNGFAEDFRTPLGGGFYLLSVDTEEDLPLPLYQKGKTSNGVITKNMMVKNLKCSNNSVYIKFEEGSARIDRERRILNRTSNAEADAVVGGWLNKEEFQTTPCSQIPKAQVIIQCLLFVLPALIGMATWVFVSCKNLTKRKFLHYEDNWK